MNEPSEKSWLQLARSHHARGEFELALAASQRAVGLAPQDPETVNAHGAILAALGQTSAALAAFDRTLELAPAHPAALGNRAMALYDLGRDREALDAFDQVLQSTPDEVGARLARADLLRRAGRLAEAIADHDRVLAHDPAHPLALQNSASILHKSGQLESALERFERLLALLRAVPARAAGAAVRDGATLDYVLGMAISTRRDLCAWEGLAALEDLMIDRVLHHGSSFKPFLSLMVSNDPQVQALCARRRFAVLSAPPARPAGERSQDRLRIGYLGGDFRDHPTAHLLAGLLESHDRARFEIRAYSTSPDDGSAMRRRISQGVDAFADISRLDDRGAARAIADDAVDILVDLSGNTDWNRPGVPAQRPAPLNVHFLGYPGPPGMPGLDYFIADSVVLPHGEDALYDCAIARLPHSYQVNDRLASAPPEPPSRAAIGLPPQGIVYAGFCQPVKLSAPVFETWMSILREVPGSILWLLDAGPIVARNLRSAASARGVDAARLVFAPHADHAAHLARFACADLLLDTAPCGAHTTASDALRAGVPFVTHPGRTFASRVGASLLTAAGLPELVVASHDEYVALAVAVGRDAAYRTQLRRRVGERVRRSPLFDTDRFRAHLEAAFEAMWRRHAAGLDPASFDVPP
ncbi:MAG: hypothetical protein CMLOHMNK_01534 [Steroidobacteraceae bacterium]|nr:hypothetical protein [Steroidobacteraceae bacterium]